MVQSPWSLEPGIPGVSFACAPSYCSGFVIGISLGNYSQADGESGHYCRGQAVVQELTLWSTSCLREAPMPDWSTLWVCHLWSLLGSALVCSEAGHQVGCFSSAGESQLLFVPSMRPPSGSCKVIYGLWLLVLSLALGESYAVN